MSNVIKFPRPARDEPAARPVPPAPEHAPAARPVNNAKEKASERMGVMAVLQCIVVVLWPVLNFVLAIDVTWQFFRMLYHWRTPGVYAGWTFLLHFGVYSGLFYFIGVYEPKGGIWKS